MKRWLVLGLGIAAAGIGLYLLATLDPAPPATDEIDDASRSRLERVLREAERKAPSR